MTVICPKNYGFCSASIQYDPKRVFVLMPFDEEVAPQSLFFDVLQSIPGWSLLRADSELTKPEIWCKICSNIQSSRAVIADLSGMNPNVFLELGLAWGFGRPFILLTQDIKSLPFDTKSFHVIKYSRGNSEVSNVEEVKNGIVKSLEALPKLVPMEEDSPEAFLEARIREGKRRAVPLWHNSNEGWKIIAEIPVIHKIGISLLKSYPLAKSVDTIVSETGAKKSTIQVYLTSRDHGYSDYFRLCDGIVELSNQGIYWILDDVMKNY